MSRVPELLPLGAEVECARCAREPDNVDAQEAFAVGYSGARRELHGGAAHYVCAGCLRVERQQVYSANVALYVGGGATPAQAADMLGPRPA